MNTKTLLIIDMQVCMAWPQAGEQNNPEAETHITKLLAHWRHTKRPIVHVRHISRSLNSLFAAGQQGCAFQTAFLPLAQEAVFEKNVPDAFIQSGLERWLHVRGIRELVIVGVSTNNSVEATARSAGNLGFATQVVSDATFTFAKADYHGVARGAEEVHAMSLANLDGEYATITSTHDLLNT
ncbi:cysteine hydrolase family protein [Thiolinea disciformis]|uniref:cysteine hydrolase family protein n=1 Tax=Thiolinea disciformis TaxID=125614 RepID=UPI000379C89C|nr:cysteine hydrolase family protein [Thiolinea disciformis]